MTTRQTPDAVREAYTQGQADMRERAAQLCDQRGAEEQEGFGLVRGTQNYFRARNAIRDLEIAALDSRAGDAGEVEPCRFVDCPPGLFRWNGLLCFKSEYSTKAGQPDAYCVDSGEYFWGGTSGDLEKRRNLIVQPVASPPLSHGEGRK